MIKKIYLEKNFITILKFFENCKKLIKILTILVLIAASINCIKLEKNENNFLAELSS